MVRIIDKSRLRRKNDWKPRETDDASGALEKYARIAGPAVGGAVNHPGAENEKHCYADL